MSEYYCTSCDAPLSNSDINIAEGVALCPSCGKLSRLSDLIDHERPSEEVINDTPRGCTLSSDIDATVIRISLRSFGGFLVTLFMFLFWNGITGLFVLIAIAGLYTNLIGPIPAWFPAPTMDDPMPLGMTLFLCLFLTPFVTIGLVMFGAVLLCMMGSTVIRIGRDSAFVRTGVGPIGRTKRFDPRQVRSIGTDRTKWQQNGQHKELIQIEANRTVRFGSGMSEAKRDWIIAVAPRPNIILIMSDDMGYSDLGCYGGEIPTPNLDGLAMQGLRYTQFYNTGRCCPTRASLLTGLYAHQAGVGRMIKDDKLPGYRGDLSFSAVTIAEALKPAGYSTYMAGKWHVSRNLTQDKPKYNWPRQRGFDRFYGTIIGAGSFFDPWTLTRDNTQITPDNDPLYRPEVYHYTDAITDNAAMFIKDHATNAEAEALNKPFFLYMAYTAPHWPLHALPQDIEPFKGKFSQGYAHYREERFKRMKELGLIEDEWQLSEGVGDWSKVKPERVAWEERCMEVYAAMIVQMDRGIGKVVQTLKDTGQYENTLILYLHDNGGCHEGMGRQRRKNRLGIQPRDPMNKDELQTKMIPDHSRTGQPVVMGTSVMPGPSETYHAYGWNWANVSNTPFRLHKSTVHEGGISTPLIAHWPAGIRAHGELRHRIGHLIDVMPTFLEVADAAYPKSFNGQTILPLEGESLVASFKQDEQPDRALMFEHFGKAAIREGRWKLVRGGADKPWELYDMANDRSEMNDLAQAMPEKVKELAENWEAEAERTLILPRPGKR
eukprot:g13365.t1